MGYIKVFHDDDNNDLAITINSSTFSSKEIYLDKLKMLTIEAVCVNEIYSEHTS